jgi:DNA-binding response OmpR family regulator
VVEAGHLLDSKFEESFDAMEAGFTKCDDSISGSMKSESSSETKQNCLIVENTPDDSVHSLQRLVELNGWKTVVVSSGEDALRLLKMKNWGFVIIDNDLPFFSGMNCIARFRDWENHSCIVKQKNIYILSDCYNPLSLPSGFDGVLRKPFDPSQVASALERSKH